MNLTPLDWTVIALYFLVTLAIGLYYSRRAATSTSEFFLSGRNAPWWLAGTSMVATTFAADTPLAVTGLVARNGIAGNWLWWSFVMSGMMTVFFYARLWRRTAVMTDVEFAETRYSGKPAAFLRGFRALYLGIPINCIILGWVNLAMIKILQETLGFDRLVADTAWAEFLRERFAVEAPLSLLILVGMLLFTALYTTLAGLWGVMMTDLFQFVLMMAMIIVLAVFAVDAVGGIESLKSRLIALDAAGGNADSRLAFFPPLDSAWMPALTLCVYLAVNWWASWYPGSEPGGGGYVAQRIFSAKDERHGVLATLWFNIAHYALRPWPWILTALVSVVLYPEIPDKDKEIGYIRTFMDPEVFPQWLRGFMIAGFAAAYMSTIATQLNWGASYVVNDFYRRFVVRSRGERHYVIVSQVVTVLLMATSLVVTLYLESVGNAWKLLLVIGAGTGLVLLLRWYWWRINAWSEVAAMVAAAAVSLLLQLYWKWDTDDRDFAHGMLVTVGVTTVAWLVVTFLTPPEPRDTLVAFYQRARPAGPGWKPIAAIAGPGAIPNESLLVNFVNWLLGCALIYAALFSIGKLIFREWMAAAVYIAVAIVAAVVISRNLSRANWGESTS
jgi:Na+/proline symporter